MFVLNRKSILSIIITVLAVSFTPFVLFISTANKFFLYNQEDFFNNLSVYIPFLALSGLLCIPGFVALCLYRKHLIWRFVFIFYLCFGYYYLSYYNIVHFGISTKYWPPMFMGWPLILIRLFVFFTGAVFLLAVYIKRAGGILLVVCASTIFVFFAEVWNFSHLYVSKGFFNINADYTSENNIPSDSVKKPNIYHILFDGYQSDIFESLADAPEFKKQLKGFTWYKEFSTSYRYTRNILPTLFLGQIYDPNGSYKSWRFENLERSFINQLRLNGYKINGYYNEYFPRKYINFEIQTPTPLGIMQRNNVIKLFFEFWLKEYFPRIHSQVKARTDPAHILDKIFPSLSYSGNETFAGTFLFKVFLNDEAARNSYNNYTYLYMLIPHPPYLVDRNCEYCPEGKSLPESNVSAYTEQARCANKLLLKFIENLKKLNRFDESLIIVQSDHGWDFRKDSKGKFFSVTVNSAKDDNEVVSKYIKAKSAALLLVKLPNDNRDFNVSNSNVNILDIAPTIMDVAKGDLSIYSGISLDRKECDRGSSKEFYFGNYIQNQIWPESFSRFIYQKDKWLYQEEIPVKW